MMTSASARSALNLSFYGGFILAVVGPFIQSPIVSQAAFVLAIGGLFILTGLTVTGRFARKQAIIPLAALATVAVVAVLFRHVSGQPFF